MTQISKNYFATNYSSTSNNLEFTRQKRPTSNSFSRFFDFEHIFYNAFESRKTINNFFSNSTNLITIDSSYLFDFGLKFKRDFKANVYYEGKNIYYYNAELEIYCLADNISELICLIVENLSANWDIYVKRDSSKFDEETMKIRYSMLKIVEEYHGN